MFSEATVIEMIYENILEIWKLWVCVGCSTKTLCFFSILKLLSDFYSRLYTLVPSTPLVETMFKEEWVFFRLNLLVWQIGRDCQNESTRSVKKEWKCFLYLAYNKLTLARYIKSYFVSLISLFSTKEHPC